MCVCATREKGGKKGARCEKRKTKTHLIIATREKSVWVFVGLRGLLQLENMYI